MQAESLGLVTYGQCYSNNSTFSANLSGCNMPESTFRWQNWVLLQMWSANRYLAFLPFVQKSLGVHQEQSLINLPKSTLVSWSVGGEGA